MKNFTFLVLLAALTFGLVSPPADAFAKSNSGSGSSHYDDSDDDGDHRGRGRGGDDRSDDGAVRLEAEADVFTDVTIIKVELPQGGKSIFDSTADTRDEVLDAIVGRLGLVRADVDAVLDFEIEDRASRAQDRKGVNGSTARDARSADRVCATSSSDVLEVEADVFTDTTIIKVERPGFATVVFETDATTTDGVVNAVESRFNLAESDIRTALDFEVEDRASRNVDFAVRGGDDCEDNGVRGSVERNDDREEKIARLQALLEQLIKLLTEKLGTLR